jgi:hypothetical protein
VLLLALLAGCGDGGAAAVPSPPERPVPVTPDAGDPASDVARRYYAAYLAETVDGDLAAARAGYEAVLEHGGEARGLAARAALRLAALSAREGGGRAALELLARAASLGGDDPELLAQVDALRLSLAEPGLAGAALRGPPSGAVLDGAAATTSEPFARAEKALSFYQSLGVRARIERFDEDVARKDAALEAAARAYRAVIELGDPVANSAAAFRLGSLYHDHALTMVTLETPPELEPAYAAPVRRDLRRRALKSFKAAEEAYAASLAAGAGASGAELWHAAARAGAREVADMVR